MRYCNYSVHININVLIKVMIQKRKFTYQCLKKTNVDLLINLITVGQENAIISAPSSEKKPMIKTETK